ncbi:MAG: COX15/CtaA family protein [Alphaproteobacteria bacterium]|nr:COX15/CtaA family protein [Alphaproteobacteria bacterium]
MTNDQRPTTIYVIAWLTICALLVVGMVAVGGYTRLSGSGLSITEWKPIHGAIPPRSEAEWAEEFAKYRAIPQYAAVNPGMTLDEFKTIFWPEFLHRLLGRIIGIVFIVPLIFFWARGAISHRQGFKFLAIFSLGGLQGFMGWYMVSSGLATNVYVSHLRLATHLTLALLLLGLIVWELCKVTGDRIKVTDKQAPDSCRLAPVTYLLWFALLCLQILYGALMAGLHAGLLYNTWPLMDGAIVPSGLSTAIFTDHTTVQFWHRILAFAVVFGFLSWWFFNRRYVKNLGVTKLAAGIALVIALQFTLGVLTLVNAVQLELGMMHQMTAVLLFVLSVVMLHRLGKR